MKVSIVFDLNKPPNEPVEQWIQRQLKKIEEAAADDAAISAADAFNGIDHTGYTILETFDPATVTTEELARAFATFLQYIQNQGARKG